MKFKLPHQGDYLRHSGWLVAIQRPDPPPPPASVYIFQDTDARIELRRRGNRLSVVESVNNFYGQGTAVETAIKEAREHAKAEKIGPKSELEIVVVAVTEQVALRPVDEDNLYARGMCRMIHVEARELRGISLKEPVEKVVWSSRKPNIES